jgi:hypothetical protein
VAGNQDQSEELPQGLEDILVVVTPDRTVPLATMLQGWLSHVRRFIGGAQTTPIRDSVVWERMTTSQL